jgi:uncharacterized protein (TIGR03000 family)
MKTFPHSAAIGAAALALMLAVSGTSRAEQAAPSNKAIIEVSVPADAKVWFDDSPTKQTGSERYYETPPLTAGKTFSYVVTAQWLGPDGTNVVRKQRVSVRANESSNVEFVPPAPVMSYYYYPVEPSYNWGDYRGGRGFRGYYRVGNVIINGRRWGDIGYRYSHADLIRW